jgi:hypothetical protein
MEKIILRPSSKINKKFMVKVEGKTIYFGDSRYEDFTIHKDIVRKERYLKRHKDKENWMKSGIHTAGFWSRWLLWNKPTLRDSIRDTEKRFDLRIIFNR